MNLNYFKELTKDREESADTFDKPSMKGARDSVVDKYSDQAHFIYELLQNADDVKASDVDFILFNDGLIFSHNGKDRFTITNPKTESEDKLAGRLGDINSICSIGQSSKGNEATIGKFGVGFKAVFQYTSTPHIYDKEIQFKIERLFVPKLIKDDKKIHINDNRTYFYFPFDKKDLSPKEAYEDIAAKLCSLTYPLLFLNNLKKITCTIDTEKITYSKKTNDSFKKRETVCENIQLRMDRSKISSIDNLWLFTRNINETLKYSAGFFLDNEGYIKKVNHGAFCYFPTKEYTGLNFIVHAPFLLTDSRENVKAGVQHNKEMIDLLADLAADSMIYLKEIGQKNGKQLLNDEFYLEILPLTPSAYELFKQENERTKLSFTPFSLKMEEMVKREEILPCSTGKGYVKAVNAYWARSPKILETFNNKQLSEIVNDDFAKWIFKDEHNWNDQNNTNRGFYDYMDNVLEKNHRVNDSYILRSEGLINLINVDNIKWLHKLYSFADASNENRMLSKKTPIFLDSNGNPSPIFEKEVEVLFLPSEIKNLKSIYEPLLENKDTKDFLLKIGLSEPNKLDQVQNGILKKYENPDYSKDGDFETIFKIYLSLPRNEVNLLVDAIRKSKYRLPSTSDGYKRNGVGRPSNMYFYDEELSEYFKGKSVKFFDEKLLVDNKEEKIEFLTQIGLTSIPKIKFRELNSVPSALKPSGGFEKHRYSFFEESYIDGLENCVERISNSNNYELSSLLWNYLLKIIENKSIKSDLSEVLYGSHYYTTQTDPRKFDCNFDSSDIYSLLKTPWIFAKKGKRVIASELSLDDIDGKYYIGSSEAKILLNTLGVVDSKYSSEDYVAIKLSNILKRYGIETEEELISILSKTDVLNKMNEVRAQDNSNDNFTANNSYEIQNEIETEYKEVYKSIEKERAKLSKSCGELLELETENQENNDTDEYSAFIDDTAKRIEKKQKEIALEINEIEKEQRLNSEINKSKKYSYRWIKNLLEKEILVSSEGDVENKKITAKFSKIDKEIDSKKTILLKNPIGRIPQSIEELSDVPITLYFEHSNPKEIVIEAFNVHSYTVKAKIRNIEQLEDIDFDDVKEIIVEFRKPTFLLKELVNGYETLNLKENFDFLTNMPRNIEFVFGPPGTGKTTYISKDEIIPKIYSKNKCKILVLTPTNKAADVVVKKLIKLDPNKKYDEWLVRFGSTQDEEIDELAVYKDKHVNVDDYDNCCLVTTVHRFWYDFCIPNSGVGVLLRDIKWDYIYIDEASMVPLVHVLYPILQQQPLKFVISGDPFQIQPVIMCDEWKNDNIFTMVGITEFSDNIKTIPYKYPITLLKRQYRSLPSIGDVYSKLTYNGLLEHERKENERKQVSLKGINLESLNIIKFPVSKYESIYSSKYLNNSSAYHIYSALFTYEFIKKIIEQNKRKDICSIGVISPYRAQADVIEKMCRSLSKTDIEIDIGTIHSFQGDECDVIICLLNTPPGKLTSDKLFVNNRNILNVAISRAKDCLIIMCPDEDTVGIDNLSVVSRLLNIMNKNKLIKTYKSHDIEKKLFGDYNYIENSAFSTTHQSVNIYDVKENRYEIRAEEEALDIQIHND